MIGYDSDDFDPSPSYLIICSGVCVAIWTGVRAFRDHCNDVFTLYNHPTYNMCNVNSTFGSLYLFDFLCVYISDLFIHNFVLEERKDGMWFTVKMADFPRICKKILLVGMKYL